MVAIVVAVQVQYVPRLILINVIADLDPDPVIIMDEETSSLIGSEAWIMVENIRLARTPDSGVLFTSGFALTALHRVHILVLLVTMLKHATPDLQL